MRVGGVYFNDRITLGKKLSSGLQDLKGKDAVILCLKDSSILTCLTMAKELRAWVYPLVFVPVYSQNAAHRTLGAVDDEGNFYEYFEPSEMEREPLSPEDLAAVEDQKNVAAKSAQKELAAYGMKLDKHRMDGRDVIIVGDVITSTLPLTVAHQFLTSVSPKSLTVVAGNATPSVADLIRVSADRTIILDVLSGVVSDDNRYFQHPDAYTLEQKHTLTRHIVTYWQH